MSDDKISADNYGQKINELCSINKHAEALKIAETMIEQDPDYSLAYMHKGWLLCEYLGKPDEGNIYYEIYNGMEEDNTPASFEHDYKHGRALFGANKKFIEISENVLADKNSDPEQIYHAHNQKALNFAAVPQKLKVWSSRISKNEVHRKSSIRIILDTK